MNIFNQNLKHYYLLKKILIATEFMLILCHFMEHNKGVYFY